MGYTTDFSGSLSISPGLTATQIEYLNKLANTRRMKRDPKILFEMHGYNYGHPTMPKTSPEEYFGKDGEFFVGGSGYMGQDNDKSVIDNNTPPGQPTVEEIGDFDGYWREMNKRIAEGNCQPSLWLQWVIEIDNNGQMGFEKLVWDGGEKFYHYVEWLKYLIKNFFEPWKVRLNGEIDWFGEDRSDFGKIIVIHNVVEIKEGELMYK